jgi:hypothetical protein
MPSVTHHRQNYEYLESTCLFYNFENSALLSCTYLFLLLLLLLITTNIIGSSSISSSSIQSKYHWDCVIVT